VVYQEDAVSFRANKEISKNSSKKEELRNQYENSKRASKTNDFLTSKKIQPGFDKTEIQKEISRAFKEKTLKVIKNLTSNTAKDTPPDETKVYLIPEKSSKLWNKNVFWSKDKLDEVWGKIKSAKYKLINKIEAEIEDLQESIRNGDEVLVLSKLMDKNYQEFYYRELLRSNLLEYILEHNQPEMLMKILKDEFYVYDYLYPFHKMARFAGISRSKSFLYHNFESNTKLYKKVSNISEIDNNLK